MSAFRKRKQPVISSSRAEAHFVSSQVGDDVFVTQVFEPRPSELQFANPSPTLDQMQNAGVAVKEVNVAGMMDSYDVNDTPLEKFEEKIVTKGRKKKDVESENEE